MSTHMLVPFLLVRRWCCPSEQPLNAAAMDGDIPTRSIVPPYIFRRHLTILGDGRKTVHIYTVPTACMSEGTALNVAQPLSPAKKNIVPLPQEYLLRTSRPPLTITLLSCCPQPDPTRLGCTTFCYKSIAHPNRVDHQDCPRSE